MKRGDSMMRNLWKSYSVRKNKGFLDLEFCPWNVPHNIQWKESNYLTVWLKVIFFSEINVGVGWHNELKNIGINFLSNWDKFLPMAEPLWQRCD